MRQCLGVDMTLKTFPWLVLMRQVQKPTQVSFLTTGDLLLAGLTVQMSDQPHLLLLH